MSQFFVGQDVVVSQGIEPKRIGDVGVAGLIVWFDDGTSVASAACTPAPIDWSAPLEAYHPDGRVVGVRLEGKPDRDGDRTVWPFLDGGWNTFSPDGSHYSRATEWRIRTVRTVTSDTTGPLTPTIELPLRGLTSDVVDRMVRLVRGGDNMTGIALRAECRAIAEMLPEPVDPDEALARRLCDESNYDLADATVVTNARIHALVVRALKAGRESQ